VRAPRLLLLVLGGLSLAGGCASGLRADAPRSAGELDAFVVAHPDDWQLFMGDVAAQAVRGRGRTTFIYLTAGEAGRAAAYWEAREQGALASVAFGLGVAPPDAVGEAGGRRFTVACVDVDFAGYPVRRCGLGGIASYFLRLPDGNLEGQGFEATGNRSLMKLEAGNAPSLARVDGNGSLAAWSQVLEVVRAILRAESSANGAAGHKVRVHASDPDTDFNPRDHADHRATGRLAASIAAEGGFGLSQYAGYSTSEWPSNLTASQFAEKAGLFMAYDRARVLVKPEWSAYAELPAGYSSWLSRTYLRPAGFRGRSR
jgi:LmbE family N-acetylglucosaminyl deacetylase